MIKIYMYRLRDCWFVGLFYLHRMLFLSALWAGFHINLVCTEWSAMEALSDKKLMIPLEYFAEGVGEDGRSATSPGHRNSSPGHRDTSPGRRHPSPGHRHTGERQCRHQRLVKPGQWHGVGRIPIHISPRVGGSRQTFPVTLRVVGQHRQQKSEYVGRLRRPGPNLLRLLHRQLQPRGDFSRGP